MGEKRKITRLRSRDGSLLVRVVSLPIFIEGWVDDAAQVAEE